MILDVALGIIVACVVLSLGRNAAWLALIGAAFYLGFGGPLIALALLAGVLFACGCIGAGIGWVWDRTWRRVRKRLGLRRGRELQWHERKEPTIT